jgi:hypothetical protein
LDPYVVVSAGDALTRMACSKIRDHGVARQFSDEGCTV